MGISADARENDLQQIKRVAILYPGEMGTVVGKALQECGFTVSTYLGERSPDCRRNASAAGFIACQNFEEASRDADLIFSLVPPQEAVNVARRFADAVKNTDTTSKAYLDANSISPKTMRDVACTISPTGAQCFDGAFLGPAGMLGTRTRLLISGAGAGSVARQLAPAMHTQSCGEDLGSASALKMSFGALNKGLIALFIEVVSVSESGGSSAILRDLLSEYYPDTIEIIRRLLPSYPKHVSRRVQEISEFVAWCEELDRECVVAQATLSILERLAGASLDGTRSWDFDELVKAIVRQNPQILRKS